MTTYRIHFTREAKNDILYLYDYIAYELALPDTAFKYFKGMYVAIDKLAITGVSYAVSQSEYLKIKYGANVRTLTYKKMIIIYNVINDIILIRRVMPGSMAL
jgi:plasmid stabilization system protein ParE